MEAREPKTKRGAMRQYRAIMNAYRRDFAGGGAFGWDWPTFCINAPERYKQVRTLQAMYKELPR